MTTVDDLLADLLGDDDDAGVDGGHATAAVQDPAGVPAPTDLDQAVQGKQAPPGTPITVDAVQTHLSPQDDASWPAPAAEVSTTDTGLPASGTPGSHSSQIQAVDAANSSSTHTSHPTAPAPASGCVDVAAQSTIHSPSEQALDPYLSVAAGNGSVPAGHASDDAQDDDLDLLSLDGLADVFGDADLHVASADLGHDTTSAPTQTLARPPVDAFQGTQPAQQQGQQESLVPDLPTQSHDQLTDVAQPVVEQLHHVPDTARPPPTLKLSSTPVSSLAALELAEEAERSLLTAGGSTAGAGQMSPAEQLDELLSTARQDWPSQGRPDASGAMIGGSVAVKLEEIKTVVPELRSVLGREGMQGMQLQQLTVGLPKVVAIQGPVLAIGMSSGITIVLQLPSIKAASAAAASGVGMAASSDTAPVNPSSLPRAASNRQAATSQSGAQGDSSGAREHNQPLLYVGEARGEAEAVTALGFSHVGCPTDPLWLVVGHASGMVVVWDLQRRPARQAVLIRGQHGLPVTHASFLPGRGTSMIITADRRGRLMSHQLATNLLLLRTTATSKPLLDGSLGIITSIAHLQPYPAILLPAAAPNTQAMIGDGVTALCTLTGCHIARFRPSGDLVLLAVVPKPQQVPTHVVPTAAWLRHTHHTFTPTTVDGVIARRSSSSTSGAVGGGSVTSGQVESERLLMPCAMMAVSWGHMVLFCDIPLLGDHKSLDDTTGGGSDAHGLPSPGTTPGAAAASTPPGGSGAQMGMSLLRSMTAAAAAGASQFMTGASMDALTPQLIKQLSHAFPVQVLRKWETGSLDPDASPAASNGGDGGGGGGGGRQAGGDQLQVLSVHWYDGDALGVVVAQGLQMRIVVVGPDLEIREQVDCFDTPPSSTTLTVPPGAVCCPEALTGQGSRMLLLGATGALYCSRLMGWQERLRTLQDVGKLPLALWYGLQFYHMHLAKKLAATASGQAPNPHDVTTMQQLAQWLLSLLVIHSQERLKAALAQAEQTGGWVRPEVQQECSKLAQLCICCCLLLGMQQPLFQQLFTVFQQAQSTLATNKSLLLADEEDLAGLVKLQPLGQFLEALEPHVLADRLPFLAPEVVHALVEHFTGAEAPGATTQPERVERCVLHLEVFTLDLDQVLRLCTSHGLYSALIYVHNRINEYRQPVIDMLAHLAGLHTRPGQLNRQTSGGKTRSISITPQRVAHKLLVYLRCIFRGQAFPPGSGSLEQEGGLLTGGGQPSEDLRAQLLGLLLFTDTQDLSRFWQVPVSQVQQVVMDPYPALQLLLRADAAATVSVLGDAVCGWDAVETELRAAAGKQTEELDSVLVATQVLVNALLLLDTTTSHPPDTPAHTATLDFVTSLVTARRVTVQPPVVLQLLQHVLQPPPGSSVLHLPAAVNTDHDAGLASARLSLSGAADPGLVVQMSELQAAVQPGSASERLAMCVVDVAGVNSVHAARQAPDRLSQRESEGAIQLLLAHGMHLGAAAVAHARGEVGRALAQHLALEHPAAPFLYIHSCLKSGQSWVRQALLAGLLAVGKQLTARSATATAAALLALDPLQQHNLLSQFRETPELRYKLLSALLGLSGKLHREAQQQGMAEEDESGSSAAAHTSLMTSGQSRDVGAGSSTDDSSSPLEGQEAGVHVSLLISLLLPYGPATIPRTQDLRYDPGACDDYVVLACQYCPSAVLPFLLTHVSYDVNKCLAAVRAAGVREAHVYLLERLGQLAEAFRLHMQRLKECSVALQQVNWAGSSAAVHVAWLLTLSPRLKTVLPQIFGAHVYSEAVQQYSSTPSASRSSSGIQPLLLNLSLSLSHTTGTRRPSYSTARQRMGSANRSISVLPVLPDVLKTFWSALTAATAFCQRCSRAEKSLQPQPAAGGATQQGRVGSSRVQPGDVGAGKAGVGEVGSQAGAGKAANTPTGSAPQLTATGCWLQLLEVCIHELRLHQSGSAASASDAPGVPDIAGTAQGLRGVLSAAVEEVVSRAAEHVQMADLVSHITQQHGQAAVGEFRSLLAGMLSACSYEQAIMEAALRLLARDAMSQVKQRCQQHSSCLPDAQLARASESEADSAGGPSGGGVGGGGGQQGGGIGQDTPQSRVTKGFSLLTDQVHGELLASHVPARATRAPARPAASTGLVFVVEGAAGEASSALDALAAAGLDPRAAVWQGDAHGGGGPPASGDYHTLSKNRRQVVHAFLSVDVLQTLGVRRQGTSRRWQAAQHDTSRGVGQEASQQQDPIEEDRNSFDVDNLLQWATQASSATA